MTKKLTIALVSAILITLLAATAPNPQEAARLNNIGVAYMNQQLFEKGLKSFEEAAAKDPASEVITVNRGVALLNLQRVDEAKALLEKATKDNPKDAHAWYNLGLYYKNSADAAAGVDAFRHVTEIDANDADTWYFLGSTYAQLKQFPEAIAAFEHALKLDPHPRLRAVWISAGLPAIRTSRSRARGDEEIPVHHAEQVGRADQPGLWRAGEVFARGRFADGGGESSRAEIAVKFVDVTEETGLVSGAGFHSGLGHSPSRDFISFLGPGACFLDYDNDGRIDVLLADSRPEGGLALFHNVGGKFEDVTSKAGLPTMHALACTTGDYDNDGYVDIVLNVNGRVQLFHNQGNGTFKDVTESAGIKNDARAVGMAFVDYDHDGDLDLYITRMVPDSTRAAAYSTPLIPGAESQWVLSKDKANCHLIHPAIKCGATTGMVPSQMLVPRKASLPKDITLLRSAQITTTIEPLTL